MARDPGERNWATPVAVIAVLAIAGAAVYLMRDRLFGTPPVEPKPAELPDAGAAFGEVEHKDPAEGDDKIRKIGEGAGGSKSPQLAAWLAAPNIIQRITAATKLVADGQSPAPVLTFLEIQGEPKMIEKAPSITFAPEAYARYDALVEAFTSIDPAYAARAYADLRPYFESAYAEVAAPGEHFEGVLKKALQRLTSVNVPDGPVELVPRGAIYLFKDPALEGMSAAEKHVLRLGPKNARAFQDALRKFAAAIKMPLD